MVSSKVSFLVALGLCACVPAVRAASSELAPKVATADIRSGVPDLLTEEASAAGCNDSPIQPQALNDAEGFTVPGVFLKVDDGDPCRSFDVPLVAGVKYKAIQVDFDLRTQAWVTPLFHNITSLRRSAKKRADRVLYYGLILRGDNGKTVLDLGNDVLKRADGPWQPRNEYHLSLRADLRSKKVTLNVFQGDTLVHSVGGRTTFREIRTVGSNVVRIDFSSPGVGDGAYFPPTGWEYSNLTVTASR